MAIIQEVPALNECTVQKLREIVENYNRNHHDEEIMALRDEIGKIKNEIGKLDEKIKIKENMNQKLTSSFLEIRLHCDIHVETTEHQIKRMKHPAAQSATQLEQTKMYFRHACGEWSKKETIFKRDIEKFNNYIHGLHSTLERNGIFCDQSTEESDGFESDQESDISAYPDSQDDYDGDCDDDFDQTMGSNDCVDVPNLNHCAVVSNEALIDQDAQCSLASKSHDCVASSTQVQNIQKAQCSELIQDKRDEEPVKAYSTTIALGSDKSTNSNELPECTDQDSKSKEQSQSIEPVHVESVVSKSSCDNVDEKPQQASSTSNARTEDKVLETDEPIEAEVPFKINMDPFVHGYVEEQIEKLKPKSKPKKQRQQKSKSKPKFSNLISFGGF